MSYLAYKGGDSRFLLQSPETGGFVGLMIAGGPNDSAGAFSYDFGSVYMIDQIINREEFVELRDVPFFSIEYPGFYDYDRFTQNPLWEPFWSWLRCEAKFIAYNAVRERKVDEPLPALWKYTPPNPNGSWKLPAYGLILRSGSCCFSNQDGMVLELADDGRVINQYDLLKNVRALAGNHSLYTACDDGYIYDLSLKTPTLYFNARTDVVHYFCDYIIMSIAVYEEYLLIADAYGYLTCLEAKAKVKWRQKAGLKRCWGLHVTEEFIYAGHMSGVSCYELATGELLWNTKLDSPVLSMDANADYMIVGTSSGSVYKIDLNWNLEELSNGIRPLACCDGAVYGCAITPDSICASDYTGHIYGFTTAGDRLWKHAIDLGSVLSMKCCGDRLYCTTTDGTIACYSLETALGASQYLNA